MTTNKTRASTIRDHLTETQIQQLQRLGVSVESLEYLRDFAEAFGAEVTQSLQEWSDLAPKSENNGEDNGDT